MIESDKIELLKNAYMNAPATKGSEYEILRIEKGESEIRQKIDETMMNPMFRLHGMFYFKLLDEATHLAASTVVDDKVLVTTSFNIYITRPVSEGWIRAEGRLVNTNRSQYITEGTLYDDQDRELARATAIFMKSKVGVEELRVK